VTDNPIVIDGGHCALLRHYRMDGLSDLVWSAVIICWGLQERVTFPRIGYVQGMELSPERLQGRIAILAWGMLLTVRTVRAVTLVLPDATARGHPQHRSWPSYLEGSGGRFTRTLRKAGLDRKGLSLYSCRHTFAADLLLRRPQLQTCVSKAFAIDAAFVPPKVLASEPRPVTFPPAFAAGNTLDLLGGDRPVGIQDPVEAAFPTRARIVDGGGLRELGLEGEVAVPGRWQLRHCGFPS
jgi:hypothetical protein